MFPPPVGSDAVVVVCVVVLLYSILAMSLMFCNRLSCRHSLLCSCVVLFVCVVVIVFVVVLCLPEHGISLSLMLVMFLPLYLS